jgi:hypothetical protein
MRHLSAALIVLSLYCVSGTAFAGRPPLDCSKKSLAFALRYEKDKSIYFTGTCSGPIVISYDRVSLIGVGSAIIDGNGQDAVTVAGTHGVSLENIEVRNGGSGILGKNGAHISLKDVNVHDNKLFGISLQAGASADLSGVSVSHNGLHGLDLQTGSAAIIKGTFASSDNTVFGVNVNGSALTLTQANASISGNAIGMQIATGGNAFLSDSATVLDTSDNLAVGLTLVSGGHMVSFGSTINVTGNPVNGISLNSKAGLDLDAGSTVDCSGNGDGLQIQEESEMTVFNTPQFSGVPGFSTLNCDNNSGDGIVVRNASTLRLSNQAKVSSTGNGAAGITVDDGSGLVLVNSDVINNSTNDIQLSFGSRADLQTSTFTNLTCDATVLIRGVSGITCPQ